MMHYCDTQREHMHQSVRMIGVVTILFHGLGLRFLEGYCQIRSPPNLRDEKSRLRRPAAYLLKIVVCIASACLLAPVTMEVYLPNMIRVAKAVYYQTHSKIEGDDLGIALSPEVASWACHAEVGSSTMHIISFGFEMLALQFYQSNSLLILHIAAILPMSLLLAGRLFPSNIYPLAAASDWLWLALGFHLTVYSLNLIRPCYSFVTNYLTKQDSSRCQPLKQLFHRANIASFAVALLGYCFVAAVVAMLNKGALWKALLCLGVPVSLFYGCFKQFLRYKSCCGVSTSASCSSTRLLLQLMIEIVIGLFVAPVLLLLDYLFPRGMKTFTNKISHKNTAGGVCALRALCYTESWDSRIFIDDPFAIQFVESGLSRLIGKSAVLRYVISFRLETQHPGGLGHLITRTKTIDENIGDLTSRANDPVRQLVILGAGYDTRAYRLKSLKDVVVFEIDQHFMSREKQRKCADFVPACKDLVHLGTDFNKESVADVLSACESFDPSKPTFFLWEGVQVYLSDDSVDKMFASIRKLNEYGGGNSIQYLYFTFSVKDILTPEGRKKIYGGEEFFEYASEMGELVKSGLDPATIEKYLLSRGFAPFHYSSCSGLSGHMSSEQKQDVFLSSHPFIRQSEIFHSCLISNVSRSMDENVETIA